MRTRTLPYAVDDLARLAAAEHASPIAFLDGAGMHPDARFSFLGLTPVETRGVRHGDAPFAWLETLRTNAAEPDAPIVEGALRAGALPAWTLALAYDLAWSDPKRLGLRRGPAHPRTPGTLVGFAHRYDAWLVGDRQRGEVVAVGETDAALAQLLAEVEALALAPRATGRVTALAVEDPAPHGAAIERALDAMREGELYQINLARRWTATLVGSPHAPRALADAMRTASPVPFGAYLEGPEGLALVGRSMERFLHLDARTRRLETRPIKGTVARPLASADAHEDDDDARAAALQQDAKEHAEHAMIVDLMRNDLGRVAELGTVEVSRPFHVEPYARLAHLVSTVRAQLPEGVGLAALLEATFPPGSITGTPKLAAIEHIEALERGTRGFYTGALGYVDREGGLSLAVAIRLAQLVPVDGSGGSDAGTWSVRYDAGGGIVDASVVAREVAETELKARVFLDAIEALARLGT